MKEKVLTNKKNGMLVLLLTIILYCIVLPTPRQVFSCFCNYQPKSKVAIPVKVWFNRCITVRVHPSVPPSQVGRFPHAH